MTIRIRRSGEPGTEVATDANPVRVGIGLWLLTITADGIDGGEFQPNQSYEYVLDSPSWPSDRLPVWSAIAYGGAPQPSFLGLPDDLEQMRIAHTSCRKPHGLGRDSLAVADDLIADDVSRRPHVLILSGDQIYADDVAAPLVPRIRRVATDIVAVDEASHFGGFPLVGGLHAASAAMGLTSSAASNHLWAFDEFLATYLLAWSSALWPDVLPTWAEAAAAAAVDPVSGLTEESWTMLASALTGFRDTLPKVQRLLANVPTLMLFDDHEVTDDWNLDLGWAQMTYGNARGSRVVTNGLLAYVLCQHWGNRPDRFSSAASAEGRALAAAVWTGNSPDTVEMRQTLGLPNGFNPPPTDLRSTAATDAITYDVTLDEADGCPLRLVLFDERTERHFATADGPAARVSLTALNRILPAPATAPDGVTVVVAPAPVFGFHLLEHYIQPAGALLPGGKETVDFEAWSLYGPTYEAVLERVLDYRRIVVLSGDVHYGYAAAIAYRKPRSAASEQAAQLTLSAARNADSLTMALHTFGDLTTRLGLLRERTVFGYAALTSAQRALLQNPPPPGTVLAYDDIADVMLGRVFRAGQQTPAVFSQDVARAYALGDPDWTYTITPIDDERAPTASPVVQSLADAAALNWADWNPANSFRTVQALRVSDLHRIGRVLVGLPQVAWVTFPFGRDSVTQELFMAVGESVADGIALTEATVSLAP